MIRTAEALGPQAVRVTRLDERTNPTGPTTPVPVQSVEWTDATFNPDSCVLVPGPAPIFELELRMDCSPALLRILGGPDAWAAYRYRQRHASHLPAPKRRYKHGRFGVLDRRPA